VWLENSLYGNSVSLVFPFFFSAIQGQSQLLGTCDNVWYSNLKRLCLGCSTHLAHSIWQATEATPPINYSTFMGLGIGLGFWFRFGFGLHQLWLHFTLNSIQVRDQRNQQKSRQEEPASPQIIDCSNDSYMLCGIAKSYIAGADRRRIWLTDLETIGKIRP